MTGRGPSPRPRTLTYNHTALRSPGLQFDFDGLLASQAKLQLQWRFCVTERVGVQPIGRGPSPRPRTLTCNRTALVLIAPIHGWMARLSEPGKYCDGKPTSHQNVYEAGST